MHSDMAQEERPYVRKTSMIMSAINEINSCLCELERRLDPVLETQPPTLTDSRIEKEKRPEPSTKLFHALDDLYEEARGLMSITTSLLRRVQL